MNTAPHFVVTGGSGFLGRHLVAELRRHYLRAHITTVDRIPPVVLQGEFVQADIADESFVRPILRKADAVFHLAAMVGVQVCRNRPEEVRRVNLEDTKKLIDWCAQESVRKFLFVSSFEVYGNASEVLYREETEPRPVSLYGQCKAEVERYLREVAERTDMEVRIVRPLNIYGPGQRPEFVVSIYLKAARRGEPLVVFGSGEQVRCFTYVEDAVRGIADAFEYTGSSYEVFNIGNNAPVRIRELAELVLETVPGSRSNIVYQDYGEGEARGREQEMRRQVPSLEKARTLLGFEASIDIRTGLRRTLGEL